MKDANTPRTEAQPHSAVGWSELLAVLAKDEAEAEREREKYFKTQHYHYYEGYHHAILNCLEKAREYAQRSTANALISHAVKDNANS